MKNSTLFTFNRKYFIWSILLLCIEIYIGAYVRDAWIRPYGGDFLVVILLYCLLRSFLNISVIVAAISVLIFSFIVEFAQYFKIVEVLGVQDNKLLSILIGTSFAWEDLLAYTLGILCVLAIEKLAMSKNLKI